MFQFEIVVTEKCNLNCEYCVPAGTKILDKNFDQINVEDVKIGDDILGFDEYSNKPHSHRKIYPTKVTNISKRLSKVNKINLRNGLSLSPTPEHFILNNRGNSKFSWKPARKYKTGQLVKTFPEINVKKLNINQNYKLGYITGMMLGDGSINEYFYIQNGWKNNQSKIRLAVKDDEIIDRIEEYLSEFDINLYRKPYLVSTYQGNVYKDALFGNTKEIYKNLNKLINDNFQKNKLYEYYCGFLAGIYDAEGSIANAENNIRISNFDVDIINEIARCLDNIKIPYKIEKTGVRILSPKNTLNNLKFIKITQSAVKRKGVINFYNKCLLYHSTIKENKQQTKKIVVYNLETKSHTFFANNIAVHNCYMINKNKHMTKEVFDAHYAALPRIMDAYGEERFTTTLFGGEPLLNWGLIEHILPMVDADPKCQGITMPTNGLLINPHMMETLKKYNVNVSLSFDGLWQEGFNRDRSGELIKYKNIVELLGVSECKVMISPQSRREISLTKNYKWFVEGLGMMNPDFTLVRDDVWHPLEVAVFKFEIKELADQVIKYIKDGIETMPGIFSLYILDTLAGEKFSKRSFGCFAGLHGLGFMPDGKVYPCARFGSADENEIFDSFAEDRMVEWNAANYTMFVNKNLTDPRTYEKCKECVLYKYCNAGCTYSQLQNGGILDSICELYKASYEQAFRIVDELKDNETFKKIMENMLRRIP